MNTATSRKLGIGRIIGLGLLAVLAVLVLWNVVWRISNNRAVARLEAAARQRGEPVTVRELAAAYSTVPDEENIHRALVKVWASEDPAFWNAFLAGARPLPQMQDEKFAPDLPILGRNSRLNYTNDLSTAELAAIREFLPTKKAHMDAVRAALRLKAYRANYDFDQTYAMLMPELAKLRREAQFFELDALDAIEEKDNLRATAAIADITSVGNCLKDDPTLIGQLVRIACYNIAISTAERLLKQRQLSEAKSGQLAQIFDEMKLDGGIGRSLVTERVIAWNVLDGSSEQLASLTSSGSGEEGPSPGATVLGFRMLRLIGMAGAEKRLMGETFDQAIRCLNKPDYATTDEMHGIFATMTEKARRFPPKMVTLMLMPALEKAGEKAVRFEALRRCAVTALAVERYRHTHQGLLPAQLGELGSAALDDPFTGNPLLLKKTTRGYVVYSAGPDRKDNDAELDPPKSGSSNPQVDIGFRVEHD
jgi:hypothetical protein